MLRWPRLQRRLNGRPGVVWFHSYSGVRWGEMAALRVQDFDMLRRRVNVSRSVTESGGLVWSTPKLASAVACPSPQRWHDRRAAQFWLPDPSENTARVRVHLRR